MRLGDLQCRQRTSLCGHLGPSDESQLLLEARLVGALEIHLPVVRGHIRSSVRRVNLLREVPLGAEAVHLAKPINS